MLTFVLYLLSLCSIWGAFWILDADNLHSMTGKAWLGIFLFLFAKIIARLTYQAQYAHFVTVDRRVETTTPHIGKLMESADVVDCLAPLIIWFIGGCISLWLVSRGVWWGWSPIFWTLVRTLVVLMDSSDLPEGNTKAIVEIEEERIEKIRTEKVAEEIKIKKQAAAVELAKAAELAAAAEILRLMKAEAAARPQVSAAAKRELLALYATAVDIMKDVAPLPEFRGSMEAYLGEANHSSRILKHKALLIDKFNRAVVRERLRRDYRTCQVVVEEVYSVEMFEEDVTTHLKDREPLDIFEQAAAKLKMTFIDIASKLRPEFESRQKERDEAARRETSQSVSAAQQENLLVEQARREKQRREHLAEARSDISAIVLAEANGLGLSKEEIDQEVELRMIRWEAKTMEV